MRIGEFPSVMWADQPIAEDARHFCDKAPMLALLLGLSGYHTAAITDGGPAGPYGGLQQGFHSYRVTDQPGTESTYRHASGWLNRHAGEKFFLFVQSYEALVPYRKAMFTPSGPGEREQVVAAYDTDIVHADMLVGLLCGELRRLGILDKTLLVITSAHGQDFAQLIRGPDGLEGPFGHALNQGLLHVPLVMRAPGLIPPGQVVSHRVALMDVTPTVLALLGMQPVAGSAGWNLKPFFEGKEYADPGRPIYSEATCWGPERKALVKGNYKLVVTPVQWEKLPEWGRRLRSAPGADPEQVARKFGGDQVCLYDLTADPLEEHNIAAARPDALADCVGALRAIMERNEALRGQHKKMVLGFASEP
jgi:hypothetical protein